MIELALRPLQELLLLLLLSLSLSISSSLFFGRISLSSFTFNFFFPKLNSHLTQLLEKNNNKDGLKPET
jgi:hypothetical protein